VSALSPLFIGFISIDCGTINGTNYEDSSTGILYVSDDSYIDTGINYIISEKYTSPSRQSSTLRSFPNGTRNCYTLPNVNTDSKYLLRATFMYGNYDGNETAQVSLPLQFDLNLDITFWRRVSITNASKEYAYEVVTIPRNNFIWVCLVNINAGTPFISALELRPLQKDLYPTAYSFQANAILFRLNYGPTKNIR
jgi:Malectin-like domain